ncbi:MAG: sulfurtransferase-like selenium metabolism protein YedF [Dehalococcoidales bacterium]
MSSKVILIQGQGLGRGDEELGKLLMANFLRLLGESDNKPKTIVFWNGGVRLLCEGSPVLEHLKRLEGQGVEILGCATCLEYFKLMDIIKAGKTTNMLRSINSMLDSEMVCL